MYVCVCHAVTDGEIRNAAHSGCQSFTELRDRLQVGTCCGRCSGCARRVLHETLSGGHTGQTMAPGLAMAAAA